MLMMQRSSVRQSFSRLYKKWKKQKSFKLTRKLKISLINLKFNKRCKETKLKLVKSRKKSKDLWKLWCSNLSLLRLLTFFLGVRKLRK